MSDLLFPKPEPVDPGNFPLDADGPLEARYGLPGKVVFCRRCIISNQRPSSTTEFTNTIDAKKETIGFDEEGICSACRFAEKKARTDWVERRRELEDLCDRYRRHDGHYDCLVPGSGGKDSFMTAHVLKYEFGMHPLTVTWAPNIYTEWGRRNFDKWIHAGFDNQLYSPNGRVHRLLTRLAVEKLFHPFQPFIFGQKNLAPKLACELDIPLVFYGEHNAEYGTVQYKDGSRRDPRYFAAPKGTPLFIGGVPVEELLEEYGLEPVDLRIYLPVDIETVEDKGVDVQHLGYYIKWHPQGAYYYAQEHGGFETAPERTPGTYSKYSSIDDKIDDFHYYTTWIKFGIGRASYDAAQEVRNGDITRDEGIALVRRFDGEYPARFDDEIFAYLSLPKKEFGAVSDRFERPVIDREYFDSLADRFRSPHLWKWQNGTWSLRHAVWDE
jgi:N-acetyl sugar amidotransferase